MEAKPKGGVPTLPGAMARARFVRVTPMKARRVVDLIRGLPAREALTVLQFAPQAASEPVFKVLASAVANAENNERLDPDTLLVSQAYVDEGPTMKRFRPRAQGRAYRIRKRTSHITVVVESVAGARPAAKKTVKKAGKKADPTRPASKDTAESATTAPAKKTTAKAAAKKAPAKSAAKATKATAGNAVDDAAAKGSAE